MRIEPIVGDIGNDQKLRFVVEQLNRRFSLLNENQTDTDDELSLMLKDDNVLVNKDGDILTNDDGEVVLSG